MLNTDDESRYLSFVPGLERDAQHSTLMYDLGQRIFMYAFCWFAEDSVIPSFLR